MEGNPEFINIQYELISKNLSEEQKNTINTKIGNKNSLTIQDFVKAAGLNNVVATVSIPSGDNSQISILDIKIGKEQIYPPTKSSGKSTKRGGGRKSRVLTRRGGGRKSRRRHNYI